MAVAGCGRAGAVRGGCLAAQLPAAGRGRGERARRRPLQRSRARRGARREQAGVPVVHRRLVPDLQGQRGRRDRARGDPRRRSTRPASSRMRGDWTRRDPAITRFLTAHGAAGVPLYLWYAPGKDGEVLPQVLTPDMLSELAAGESVALRPDSGLRVAMLTPIAGRGVTIRVTPCRLARQPDRSAAPAAAARNRRAGPTIRDSGRGTSPPGRGRDGRGNRGRRTVTFRAGAPSAASHAAAKLSAPVRARSA